MKNSKTTSNEALIYNGVFTDYIGSSMDLPISNFNRVPKEFDEFELECADFYFATCIVAKIIDNIAVCDACRIERRV